MSGEGSVIFAFLIIFLGLFGIFLFGGLIWHYIRASRHAALVEAILRHEHARTWSGGKPVLRDIHVNAPRASLGTFADDLPIGVQPTGLSNHDKPEPSIDPTNDMLTADLTNWGILKWALHHFPDAARSRLRRVGIRIRISARPASTPAPASDGPADESPWKIPLGMKDVAVSVMIAMPAPRRQRAEDAEDVLDEHVLGIMSLPFR